MPTEMAPASCVQPPPHSFRFEPALPVAEQVLVQTTGQDRGLKEFTPTGTRVDPLSHVLMSGKW